VALALASGFSIAGSTLYTLDGDFDLGTLTGVNHTVVNNQLQLNVSGTSFPVLWIANAGEDTLSKIDTNQIVPPDPLATAPGKEVARYRTWFNSGTYAHDAWSGAAPSRTAVDIQGNAYVADRSFGNYPYVFKILNNTFIDRNGNGVEDTSTDTNGDGTIQPGEMMPLVDANLNGIIDQSEIQDERIAWVRRVPDGSYGGGMSRSNGVARALCIGTDGNLWVGLYNNAEYFKISAADGHTIAGPVGTGGYPNYGCLIDQNGTLWGASWSYGRLHRIDNTASDTGPYPFTAITGIPAVYGLALGKAPDGSTNVYMGGSCNSYVQYNTVTGVSYPADVNYCTYAVGTDNDGNVLVSKQTGGVVKFNPIDGSVIWDKVSQVGSSDSRGVIADANNDIWQVHRATHNIAKYAGATGNSLGVKGVGYEPYTYSDASGTAALSITTKTGTWEVVKDSNNTSTQWNKVSWNANVPTGASVTAEFRVANTTGDLAGQAFVPIANGGNPGVTGRFIEVRVRLTANAANESPIVYDVTIGSADQAKCDVDQDGDIDKIDLSLISKARGQTPTANDPRDANSDGKIDPADVKVCIPKCTLPGCAIPTAPAP
jgi:hypothetical protein